MQFFIFVILICFFVFLYCVYLLGNDDFIFLRRDVTMEKLFNLIFIGSVFSFFFSRLFYGLFYSKSVLANPFVFTLFPYFPGLSLLGAVLGGGLFLGFLKSRKKNTLPIGRMADFFSIALLITLPIGFLGDFLFAENDFYAIKTVSIAIAYLVLFIIFLRFLLPQLLNGKFKEGTISLVFLVCFSLINLISNALPKINVSDYFKNFENLILIMILLVSSALIFKQEDLLPKIKDFKKKK